MTDPELDSQLGKAMPKNIRHSISGTLRANFAIAWQCNCEFQRIRDTSRESLQHCSAAENAIATETHCLKVDNIQSGVDGAVIDELRQRPVKNGLDCVIEMGRRERCLTKQ